MGVHENPFVLLVLLDGRILCRNGLLPVTCGVKRVDWELGCPPREKGFVPVDEETWKEACCGENGA